ncbi:sugar transferase [Streptomyces sp. NPDC004111]|uniref:sugar transferase n=1 Tax=Streptomyces sp. NPDC004111 TaxID=3364690 RepID=UPI00369A80DB
MREIRPPSAKRVLDLAGGTLLLVLLSPVLAAAFAVLTATSPGDALLRRTRAGLGGKPFAMLEFRTRDAGAAGRLLRRFALDELPQLINVVRGEMSLVGPRPQPVADLARTGPARSRLAVRPGITGLWQIHRDSELPWDERELLDLEYVDTHCLAVDLAILARTVPVVLNARTAH